MTSNDSNEKPPDLKKRDVENDDNDDNVEKEPNNCCPVCKKSLFSVLKHITKSENCRQRMKDSDLKELENKSRMITKLKQKEGKLRYNNRIKELIKENPLNEYLVKIKKRDNDSKARSMNRQRILCNEQVKDDQNARKAKSRANEKEKKEVEFSEPKSNKEKQATRLNKLRETDYQKTKDDQNERKARSRAKLKSLEKSQPKSSTKKIDKDPEDWAAVALRKFRRATMCGPIFICVSCHGKMFESTVQKFTEKLMEEVDQKIALKDCIADLNLFTRVEIITTNSREPDSFSKDKEIGDRYICKTCLKYLRRGKLPPSSVMNNLQLHETDEELKAQDLVLTELEGARSYK